MPLKHYVQQDTNALHQDYGAVSSALIVNENTFSISISPAAMQVP
jgi:hypothetical protein